jgi:hypothetical protein
MKRRTSRLRRPGFAWSQATAIAACWSKSIPG